MFTSLLAVFVIFLTVASKKVGSSASGGCTATISSLSDVAAAKTCTTININSFTVPAGKCFDLTGLVGGTVVNLNGDITFAHFEQNSNYLIRLTGNNITFNGNSHTFNGLGASYWDGKGGSGGKKKPTMMYIHMTGLFTNLRVINSPIQVFNVNGPGPLTIENVSIDNSAGDSGGLAKNTDCFDSGSSNVTYNNITCKNQDDCIAIHEGVSVTFQNSLCSNGHGISIGSIGSNQILTDVLISGNTIVNSAQGLRIKTVTGATGSTVARVTYSGNTVTKATQYGVVIIQNYKNGGPHGAPTNGVQIKDISFVDNPTTVSVANENVPEIYIVCGSGSCTGTWDWSSLAMSGGSSPNMSGAPPISGLSSY